MTKLVKDKSHIAANEIYNTGHLPAWEILVAVQ